jgi:hypothetical protein
MFKHTWHTEENTGSGKHGKKPMICEHEKWDTGQTHGMGSTGGEMTEVRGSNHTTRKHNNTVEKQHVKCDSSTRVIPLEWLSGLLSLGRLLVS